MKAYLINPIDETITEVDYEGDFQQIYKHIDANIFSVVNILNDDSIYVDDEGLYKDVQYFYMYKDIPTPLCGKSLVLGTDYESGNSTAVNVSLLDLKESITFIGKKKVDNNEHGFTIATIN
tara:strand:+ start:618 stop:980 length:363 start_codon:yes stop_codon:yes gene_type:complete